MKIKSCLKSLLVVAVVSFAYSANTTSKVVAQPPVLSSIKSDGNGNGLKKQQNVQKPTTTWSKIKDLFM